MGSGPAEQPSLGPEASGSGRSSFWLAALGIVLLVAAIYGQVAGHGFVNFDDPRYVYRNARVQAGLTWEGVAWAFGTLQVSNWHPLTWLSHMLDVSLFGVEPGWHHLVNVLLHALDSVLVLAVFQLATGRTWRSAAVAALFAVHPLHVESVAWISERKDVLSTLFWLLAMLAYLRWVRAPGRGRYALVLAAFALGLLSKPMVVTLPVALLLLDWWPLARLPAPGLGLARSAALLLREKVPLLVLSAASAAVTFLAQAKGGSVSPEEVLPLFVRLENAVGSLAAYLAQTVWPTGLAAIYPHPGLAPAGIPASKVAASAALLAAITAAAVWQRRRRPYLLMGWAWYLVTLMPVIGIVQVGIQARADRYTYLPHLGLFAAAVWLLADAAEASALRRRALAAAAALGLAALSAAAWRQAGYWKDSFTLFEHALAVTRDNGAAWRNLGAAHVDAGQFGPAIAELNESLRLAPYDGQTWLDLAIAHASTGQPGLAEQAFRESLRRRPGDPLVWFNLGIAMAMQGRWNDVAEVREQLRRLSPEMADQLDRRLQAGAGR
jgi:tetratricopeptide (TPR) repeat protein